MNKHEIEEKKISLITAKKKSFLIFTSHLVLFFCIVLNEKSKGKLFCNSENKEKNIVFILLSFRDEGNEENKHIRYAQVDENF